MKNTSHLPVSCMFTMTILSTFLSACAEEVVDDVAFVEADDDGALSEAEGLRPFHVAVFDHKPTEEEIETEFRDFQNSIDDLVAENDPVAIIGPTGYIVPGMGQKLVRIEAVTSNITNAGTDASAGVRFIGRWDTNAGPEYLETFILDNPSLGDLDRNTTSIFYYLMNLNAYVPGATQDKFLQGKIANVSTDGWHCLQVKVRDYSHSLTYRLQSLVFNQWVDSPTAPESGGVPATNTGWKSFN